MTLTRELPLPGLPRIDLIRHPVLRAAGVEFGVLRLDLPPCCMCPRDGARDRGRVIMRAARLWGR
ncbi:MAG: hypothetical protein IPH83_14440 [Gammaproteobacteria bacterium]|nr:hypothetical protein [Gammaproteobacteria bacterium]